MALDLVLLASLQHLRVDLQIVSDAEGLLRVERGRQKDESGLSRGGSQPADQIVNEFRADVHVVADEGLDSTLDAEVLRGHVGVLVVFA